MSLLAVMRRRPAGRSAQEIIGPCMSCLADMMHWMSSGVLDGGTATVRNARWRKVICAESLEAKSLETKQPA